MVRIQSTRKGHFHPAPLFERRPWKSLSSHVNRFQSLGSFTTMESYKDASFLPSAVRVVGKQKKSTRLFSRPRLETSSKTWSRLGLTTWIPLTVILQRDRTSMSIDLQLLWKESSIVAMSVCIFSSAVACASNRKMMKNIVRHGLSMVTEEKKIVTLITLSVSSSF